MNRATVILIYLATIVGGEFDSGEGIELQWSGDSPEGGYRPVRLTLAALGNHDVRPKALMKCIAASRMA